LTWGPDGKLYVTDDGATTFAGQVVRYNANGSFDEAFAHASDLPGQFPSAALFTSAGHLLTANLGPTYPASFGGPGTSGSIYQFHPSGAFVRDLTASSFPADQTTGVTNFSPGGLTLDAGNTAPTGATAGTTYVITQGAPLTLHASATDADGD